MLKRLLSLLRSAPATVPTVRRSPATDSTLVRAANGGAVLVEIGGEPFGDRQELGSAVTRAMESVMTGLVIRFTTDPGCTRHPDIRVAVTVERAPSSGRLKITAEFRDGADLLAAAEGWAAAASPDDQAFRRLVEQLARTLFDNTTQW